MVDTIDARLLLALAAHPRSTVVALSERLGLARNTVQARLAKLEEGGALGTFERRITPESIGYPLTAFVTAQVTQSKLDGVSRALGEIPEVLQVHGISGPFDLLIHVVATDTDDLYRVAGTILAVPGIVRTTTSLVMRELVDYRITGLVERRIAAGHSSEKRQ